MDTKAKDALTKKLTEIIDHITSIPTDADSTALLKPRIGAIGEGVFLTDDNFVRYEKFFEQVWAKFRHDERFNREGFDLELKQLIVRIVKAGTNVNIPSYFDQFVEYLETY